MNAAFIFYFAVHFSDPKLYQSFNDKAVTAPVISCFNNYLKEHNSFLSSSFHKAFYHIHYAATAASLLLLLLCATGYFTNNVTQFYLAITI